MLTSQGHPVQISDAEDVFKCSQLGIIFVRRDISPWSSRSISLYLVHKDAHVCSQM